MVSQNHAKQILTGMSAICEYTGLDERQILFLIRECSFPARKTRGDSGVWISNTQNIDEWSRRFSYPNPSSNA